MMPATIIEVTGDYRTTKMYEKAKKLRKQGFSVATYDEDFEAYSECHKRKAIAEHDYILVVPCKKFTP